MKELRNIRHGFDLEVGDVGVTIRKGQKWSSERIGIGIELWNCNDVHEGCCQSDNGCKKEGEGEVIGSWVGVFGKLPPNLLSIEHNNECKDFETLRMMMERGYGSCEDNDIVTALIYLRTA